MLVRTNVCIGNEAGVGFSLSLVRGGERLMNGVCIEVWGRYGQALFVFWFGLFVGDLAFST